MDANEVLTLTCQRLKEEAGRSQDFAYSDLAAVKQEQAGEVKMAAVRLPPPINNKMSVFLRG